MGDTITVLNNLAADPAFHALSDDEQKAIIQKVKGTQAPALPGGLAAPPPVNQNAINAKQVKPVESFTGGAGPSGYMFGNPKSVPEAQGNIIDILRNIVPPAAGALGSAGGALGSVAAFTGSDALLKQLKPGNKESIPESLQNSLTQAAINEAGGRIIGGLWKAGKAFTAADQPEILKFLPTASQALKAEGKSPTTSSILKYVEDHFAPGAKAAAQANSAQASSAIGAEVSGTQNAPAMVRRITGDLVPETEFQKITIKNKTADYQPLKFEPKSDLEAPYTPIKVQDRPVTPQHPVSGQKEVIPESKTKIMTYPQEGVRAQVTGPIEQVTVPGAYEIAPGVVKKTPFATDPASLDKLIAEPNRLQDALTRSQANGIGANLRQDLASYRLGRIQQEATTTLPDGTIRLNGGKMQELLNDPNMAESHALLMSNRLRSNAEQFYKNVAATQDKAQGFGGFGKLRLAAEGIALTGGIARGLVTMNPLPAFVAAAPIAIEVGLSGLAKTLTNPKTARLMLALANNEALGVSDEYAARQLMQALKGTAVNLVQPDGTKTPARIQDGKMTPVGQ